MVHHEAVSETALSPRDTPDPTQTPDFWMEVRASDRHAIVRIVGELDMATAERFRVAAQQALDEHNGRIVVDMSELTFCDSCGIRALLQFKGESLARGRELVVCEPTPIVRRVFELTDADKLLAVECADS